MSKIYHSFEINNFKSINKAIINLKENIIGVVGINESGKTTALKAINYFANYDPAVAENLYNLNDNTTKDIPTIIKTEILFPLEELKNIVEDIKKDYPSDRKYKTFSTTCENLIADENNDIKFSISVVIYHNAEGKSKYLSSVFNEEIEHINKEEIVSKIVRKIIAQMPSIIYIDTFDDKMFLDEVDIKEESKDNPPLANIIRIIEKYNKEKKDNVDLLSIDSINTRETIESNLSDYLNDKIAIKWNEFWKTNPKENELLKIKCCISDAFDKISFKIEEKNDKNTTYYLTERSHGFRWFFNYTLKTVFFHKYHGEGNKRLYLLDEPGAYLHPSAQEEFCKNLKELSKEDIVVYTTHSPYMINPKYINRNSLYVAKKNSGKIEVKKATELSSVEDNKSYKVIADALQMQNSFILDIKYNKSIIFVEGIKDYFALKFVLENELKEKTEIICLNSSDNDERINTIINFINGLGLKWIAIFDNDESGDKGYKKVIEIISENDNKYQSTIAEQRLHKLDPNKDGFSTLDNDYEIHHLFSINDRQKIIERYKQNNVKNCLCEMFYDSNKYQIDDDTRSNFLKLLEIIKNKLTKIN